MHSAGSGKHERKHFFVRRLTLVAALALCTQAGSACLIFLWCGVHENAHQSRQEQLVTTALRIPNEAQPHFQSASCVFFDHKKFERQAVLRMHLRTLAARSPKLKCNCPSLHCLWLNPCDALLSQVSNIFFHDRCHPRLISIATVRLIRESVAYESQLVTSSLHSCEAG